jgi:glycosyltransferase involved in cell wall biosynthesis
MPYATDSGGASHSRRLLLSAFGVHSGGGLVLLKALLPHVNAELRLGLLDRRLLASSIGLGKNGSFRYVGRSFILRLISLVWLSGRATTGDTLFCFNSLPPLYRCDGRVINYVHAPHFIGAHDGIKYTLRTKIRMFVERLWFRAGIRYCDEIWVQTVTMAEALRSRFSLANVSVVPFVDDELFVRLNQMSKTAPGATTDYSGFSFFYPADGVGHKNHTTLLSAWEILGRGALAPALYLTIGQDEYRVLIEATRLNVGSLKSVVALGKLRRDEVLAKLSECSALIFPSKAETFGLPMLEASALGVPIIASERDFVRDVCVPQHTFDPGSPRSIALAVRRFMDGPAQQVPPCISATAVAKRLIQ